MARVMDLRNGPSSEGVDGGSETARARRRPVGPDSVAAQSDIALACLRICSCCPCVGRAALVGLQGMPSQRALPDF